MPSDGNTPIDIQRAIAADGRDHRRLMLDEWRLNVQTPMDTSIAVQKIGAEYAQIGLRSAFLVNAGALVALPPLMQWLGASQRTLIPESAWWFVVGLLLAAFCSIISYINFMILGAQYNSRANVNSLELAVQYGLREKTVLESESYQRDKKEEDRLKPWLIGTMILALSSGIFSYFVFLIGAFEFRKIVM